MFFVSKIFYLSQFRTVVLLTIVAFKRSCVEYNLPTIQLTLWKCTGVHSCSGTDCRYFRMFSLPSQGPHSCLPPTLFLLVWLPTCCLSTDFLLRACRMSGIIWYVIFWMWLLAHNIYFQNPFVQKHVLVPKSSYSKVKFYCAAIPEAIYPSSDGHTRFPYFCY